MENNKFLWFLIVLVIQLLFVYLAGSFIAWDSNPLHWWLFTSTFGRMLLLLILGSCFGTAFKAVYED